MTLYSILPPTFDGSEIRFSPVELASLSTFLPLKRRSVYIPFRWCKCWFSLKTWRKLYSSGLGLYRHRVYGIPEALKLVISFVKTGFFAGLRAYFLTPWIFQDDCRYDFVGFCGVTSWIVSPEMGWLCWFAFRMRTFHLKDQKRCYYGYCSKWWTYKCIIFNTSCDKI